MYVDSALSQYVVKSLYGIAFSLVGWVLTYPIKSIIKKVKGEWEKTTGQLTFIQSELTTQRTNCLTTLQKQGDRQVELLMEATGTLRSIDRSQGEMAGYLKGMHDKN
jgi:hypothetical protein